jgi:hypothetical protein
MTTPLPLYSSALVGAQRLSSPAILGNLVVVWVETLQSILPSSDDSFEVFSRGAALDPSHG